MQHREDIAWVAIRIWHAIIKISDNFAEVLLEILPSWVLDDHEENHIVLGAGSVRCRVQLAITIKRNLAFSELSVKLVGDYTWPPDPLLEYIHQ